MSRIHRCADEGKVSDWILDSVVGPPIEKGMASAPKTLTEENDVQVRDQIERCASEGKPFYYDQDMDPGSLGELKEYASIVGLPAENIVAVDQTAVARSISIAAKDSAEATPNGPAPIVDLDMTPKVATDPKNFEKDDSWDSAETVKAKDLSYKPDMQAGVRALRGGEDYNKQPIKGVREGEASIGAPDAIKSSVNDETKSSRQNTIDESAKRRNNIAFDRDDWESEASASMDKSSILPNRGAHLTESPMPQKHSKDAGWNRSISPDADGEPMPDRTVGETLAQAKQEQVSGIQRDKPEADDWEDMQSATPSTVSDPFYESLKKHLGK